MRRCLNCRRQTIVESLVALHRSTRNFAGSEEQEPLPQHDQDLVLLAIVGERDIGPASHQFSVD
jgi:hypothetical protein